MDCFAAPTFLPSFFLPPRSSETQNTKIRVPGPKNAPRPLQTPTTPPSSFLLFTQAPPLFKVERPQKSPPRSPFHMACRAAGLQMLAINCFTVL